MDNKVPERPSADEIRKALGEVEAAAIYSPTLGGVSGAIRMLSVALDAHDYEQIRANGEVLEATMSNGDWPFDARTTIGHLRAHAETLLIVETGRGFH